MSLEGLVYLGRPWAAYARYVAGILLPIRARS